LPKRSAKHLPLHLKQQQKKQQTNEGLIMSTISLKPLPLGQRPSVAALIMLAIMFSADAGAQGAKSGNTVGAPSGAVGGGTAGATSRNGASGVSNPSPGGSPAMTGGPQSSSGPQANQTSRSGYAGGRSSTDVVNPTSITSATAAQYGKCPSPGANPMTAQARLSGDNFGRIETVSRYLTSGPKPAKNYSATYLLVDLQEELQKTRPDLVVAGTYLGIISAKPMTPSLAADISESLCAPVSSSAAATMADVAEAQQRKLAQER
jgi:hypothetical protein